MGSSSINIFPLWDDLRDYQSSKFFKDLVAALSVALLALPQSMAYAFVAGLPPQVGIFSAIFGTIFASAFGESRYLICGPTTQSAILLQSGLGEIMATYYPGLAGVARDVQILTILAQLVLLIGLFQFIAGLLRLGRLTQFTSRSVIAGYSVGVALAIFAAQIFPFFGLASPVGNNPLYMKAWIFISHVSLSHLPTLILSLICLAIFIIATKLPKLVPVPIIVFCLAALAVYFLNLAPDGGKPVTDVIVGESANRITLFGDIGPVYTDFPKINIPVFEIRIIGNLVPLAFAIALLGVIQAAAIGRSYAKLQDPSYNDNQEVFGLGISNIICSILGAMPSSGNFSRSVSNHSIGAKTRFAGVFSGIILFSFILFLGPLVTRIPLAALSALMVLTAYQMLNARDLGLCIRATRSDAFVVIMTIISCIFFTFDTALYIGVAISVVLYLKQAAIPYIIEYTFTSVGKLRPIDPDDERPDNRVAIFQPEGELFFGAADLLQTKLRLIGEDENIKVIILQLLNVRNIDASICLALKHLNKYLHQTNRLLLISGVGDKVFETLKDAGLVNIIGKDAIFLLNEQLPGAATREAYAKAKSLL